MAAFKYKLEFLFDNTAPSDESVFVQMRDNPPIYRPHTAKEDYDVLTDSEKHEFLTALFTIAGVVEASTTAYRVWLMKAPVYNWTEVLAPVLDYLMTHFAYDSLEALPGSGRLDGTGGRLAAALNRRRI